LGIAIKASGVLSVFRSTARMEHFFSIIRYNSDSYVIKENYVRMGGKKNEYMSIFCNNEVGHNGEAHDA
jgi:hypothetical protein